VRIAIVGGVFGRSGAYRAAVRWTPETVLVEGLKKRGHDVVGIAHSSSRPLSEFDVVHVHHLSWGAIGASTERGGAPFVFTLHATQPAYPRAMAYVMARADGVVALWQRQAVDLATRYRRRMRDVAVIPNGVDPSAFPFEQPHPPDGTPWELLYVGQLIPGKGVDVLLHAVAEVRRRHEVRLSLHYQVSQLEDQLRELARDLDLDEAVRFVGRTAQEQLRSAYHSSHLVILPSTGGHEALPSVLTETMLTGAFPVSTDLGGIRDQLEGFGVLVPVGDVSALAGGIEEAIASYGDHVRRARGMRERAVARFSIENMVASHERFYEALAAGGRIPRRHVWPRSIATVAGRYALALARSLGRTEGPRGSRPR
jgi:glycosyltransferase involved in cell wall biosynthesis